MEGRAFFIEVSKSEMWPHCWKGGRCLFNENFTHFLHFSLVPKMKPILHFMRVCSIDLYQSLLDLISVEVGFVPDYGWASESRSVPFSPLDAVFMNKVNIFFFVQKGQLHTTQWACNPSFSTIMSHLFCHPCFLWLVYAIFWLLSHR